MIYEIVPVMANHPLWVEMYSEEEIIWMVMDYYIIHFGHHCFIDLEGEDLSPGLLNLEEEPQDFTDPYGVIIATFNPLPKEIK